MQLLKNIFKPSFIGGVLLFFYSLFMLKYHVPGYTFQQIFSIKIFIFYAIGAVTVILFSNMIMMLSFGNNIASRVAALFLVMLSFVCTIFNYRGVSVDYAVLVDNLNLIFYRESRDFLFLIPKRKDYILFLLLLLLIFGIDLRYKKLKPIKGSLLSCAISFFLFVGINLSIPYTYDEVSQFFRSCYFYYYPKDLKIVLKRGDREFPYMKYIEEGKVQGDRPHIFLLFVESFNANYVNAKNLEGKTYTPFFNSLIEKGVYFDSLFSPSIQTSKGHLSTLCSILPLTRQKVFNHFPKINLQCLPQVLWNHGYRTIFTKAYHNVNYGNTSMFMLNNGFDEAFGMNDRYITREEKKKFSWNWGIQDNIYYKKVFKRLDLLKEKGEKKPFFISLTTVSNHASFQKVPRAQRYIVKDQRNQKDYYANSLRVTDEYLKTFFKELESREYLKDSLIIILGDHSYPQGEHGLYFNSQGYYNEFFKTPLLIIWKDHLRPRTISRLSSQIDVAPSVLKLLKIQTTHHFLGHDLFNSPEEDVHLIQPYRGRFIGVITKERLKYIYHERTHEEYVYDLKKDPLEKVNKRDLLTEQEIQILRDKTARIYLNDYLIRHDKIWKSN